MPNPNQPLPSPPAATTRPRRHHPFRGLNEAAAQTLVGYLSH